MRIDPRTNLPFDRIYADGGWNGKGSGPGSTEVFTRGYRKYLERMIRALGAASVVDLGCGDWQFSRYIDWRNVVYTGIDIVPAVIQQNKDRYGSASIHFRCSDFTNGLWPKADLLIVKDVLHHIGQEDAENIVEYSSTYPAVLWTVDVSGPGDVEQVSDTVNRYMRGLPNGYEFDTRVDGYPYGRKVTKLAINAATV